MNEMVRRHDVERVHTARPEQRYANHRRHHRFCQVEVNESDERSKHGHADCGPFQQVVKKTSLQAISQRIDARRHWHPCELFQVWGMIRRSKIYPHLTQNRRKYAKNHQAPYELLGKLTPVTPGSTLLLPHKLLIDKKRLSRDV